MSNKLHRAQNSIEVEQNIVRLRLIEQGVKVSVRSSKGRREQEFNRQLQSGEIRRISIKEYQSTLDQESRQAKT